VNFREDIEKRRVSNRFYDEEKMDYLEEGLESLGCIKISGFLGSIRYRIIREGVFLLDRTLVAIFSEQNLINPYRY